MPKPVLSDSLFNADDVATAVLAEANLQVTNSDLGVVDRANKFTLNNPPFENNAHSINAHSFNGFMFLNFSVYSTTMQSNGDTIYTINDSDFYPTTAFTSVGLGYEGDLVNFVRATTGGVIQISHPSNSGGTYHHINCQMFYRFT